MSFPFDSDQGLIVVSVELTGPSGCALLRFALDTGATASVVNADLLASVGYDSASFSERLQVTTGSGVEFAPRVTVQRIRSMGHERTDFPVLCYTLPPGTGVDGVIGLDFVRGQRLVIDFRSGRIDLA